MEFRSCEREFDIDCLRIILDAYKYRRDERFPFLIAGKDVDPAVPSGTTDINSKASSNVVKFMPLLMYDSGHSILNRQNLQKP